MISIEVVEETAQLLPSKCADACVYRRVDLETANCHFVSYLAVNLSLVIISVNYFIPLKMIALLT